VVIPYGRQSIDEDDIAAVAEVLRSPFLTQGPAVPRFEAILCERTGAQHAVAVNSGTSALHIACLSLGLGPGDRLWTSPITFVASANAALYCGATVDFIDIDPRTYLMDVELLEAKLASAAADGTLPKIVMPVHIAGQSCDMVRIAALARLYRFRVVEDASHAVGASYRGEPVGSCRFSDVAIFSFHPVKIVTTGEGGAAMTGDDAVAERMRLLRSHGITKEPGQMIGPSEGPWYYQQIALGFNYRITDIQAALGASQLQRIDEYLARRRTLAARYNSLLAGLPITLPWQHPDTLSSWHLYLIALNEPSKRRQVFEAMQAKGIGVQVLYIPVHTQPYFRALGFKSGDFSRAERYYSGSFTLPIFAALTDQEQDTVVAALRESLREAS
jgi:UDP-4-amino-4,6-dideoxy-N-acetyl-beta-L-altrosamine transaminase